MIYAGIDYSLTSPSICVYNNVDEVNAAAVADIFETPSEFDEIIKSQSNPIPVDPNTPLTNNIGVDDALARSQELAEILKNQIL